MRKIFILLLIFVSLTFLVSCAKQKVKSEAEQTELKNRLMERVNAYWEARKAGDQEMLRNLSVSGVAIPQIQMPTSGFPPGMQQKTSLMLISDYKIQNIDLLKGAKEAEVTVKCTQLLPGSPVPISSLIHQLWVWQGVAPKAPENWFYKETVAKETTNVGITLLYSGRLLGRASQIKEANQEYGGLAARSTYVQFIREGLKEKKDRIDKVLLLDAGNMHSDSKEIALRKAPLFFESAAIMNYDALNLASVELQLPPQVYQDAYQKWHLPFISANVSCARGTTAKTEDPEATASNFIQPYKSIAVDGFNIAIIGLADDQNSNGRDPGWVVEDPIATLKKLLPEITSKHQLILLLVEKGSRQMQTLISEQQLEAVDLMICSGEPDAFVQTLRMGKNIFLQPEKMERGIGSIRMLYQENVMTSYQGQMIQIPISEFKLDPKINELLEKFSN